jgi:hypothetical protein
LPWQEGSEAGGRERTWKRPTAVSEVASARSGEGWMGGLGCREEPTESGRVRPVKGEEVG